MYQFFLSCGPIDAQHWDSVRKFPRQEHFSPHAFTNNLVVCSDAARSVLRSAVCVVLYQAVRDCFEGTSWASRK